MQFNELSFVYPQRTEEFQTVTSKQHLNKLIEQEMEELEISRKFFKVTKRDNRLYANCFSCTAYISYKLNEESGKYKLLRLKNQHSHDRSPSEFTKKIHEFMLSFPLSISAQSLKYLTMREFKITLAQYYYYKKKMVGKPQQVFKVACGLLDELSFTCRYFPQQCNLQSSIPDIFLAVDTKLVKRMHPEGPPDIITFDITYNCIKNYKEYRDSNGVVKRKYWGIGLFCGKSFANKPVVFGFVLINSQKQQDFVMVFQNFIQIVGSPTCIITDQQLSIKNALNFLRQKNIFTGLHRLDTFHIIHNLKKKLRDSPIFGNLHRCVFSKNADEYEYYLQRAKTVAQTDTQMKIIKTFNQSANLYCMSKTVNEIFQGLQLNTSTHEKLNDLLKKKIPYSVNVFDGVLKLLEFTAETEFKSTQYEVCKHTYQVSFGNTDLKMLRFLVCQKIFLRIVKMYVQSLQLQIQKKDQNTFIVQNSKIMFLQGQYRCSCTEVTKTGLPCLHLLRFIKTTKRSIIDYVNKRWLVMENYDSKKILKDRIEEIKVGYSKTTRRRMKNRY